MSGGWTRVVLRRALAGVVPDAVRWRPRKSDLSPAFTRGLVSYERNQLDDIVFTDPAVVEPFVDVERLRETWSRCLQSADSDDVLAVWRVATLALWLRRKDVTP